MNEPRLITPTVDLEKEYNAMLLDWQDEQLVPFVLEYDHTDFSALVQRCRDDANGNGTPMPGKRVRVPNSTLWLVNDKNKILGVVNIRHQLDDTLRNVGGHIGFGIRPSERRKGYASLILELALEEIQKMGINDVMVSCFKNNPGSSKSILRNGGVLTKEQPYKGKVVQKYWIRFDSRKDARG